MLSSSKDDPPPSSSKDDPQSSLEKLAVIYLQDNHARRLEWYAFDVSDDPKLNQIPPPLSLRYLNHRLNPSFHEEDDESESKVYLKPIATASNDHKWSVMRAILDNYLYRFRDPGLTQQFRGNMVERISIKDISPNSAPKWERVDSLPILVFSAHALVLGGKLYCLGGVNKDGPWAVAYDPDKAKWESLPDPPHRPYSVRTIFSASLEKSTLVGGPCIVVGSPDDGVLQIYNPDAQRWFTRSFDIKGSSIVPDDLVGNSGHPLVVDNNLYWYSVRSGEILCAYDLSTNVWSMARLPIHDEEEYFSQFKPHFPPSLAHLGSGKFCLFWVSPLPVEPRDNEVLLLPKPEDFSTRLHCLKFRVTTSAGNLRPNSEAIIPLDVSIISCQYHLVSGIKDFRGGFGCVYNCRDGHLGFNFSNVISDNFENLEAPGLTVPMQEKMAVEVPGMKRNLKEYGVGLEPSSSKHYSSDPSHEKVRVLKKQVETWKDVCQRQAEKIRAYDEQLENNSKLINDQAKKIEQLEAFMCAHMQGGRVEESSSW